MSRYAIPGRPLNLTDRFLLHNLADRPDAIALIVDHPERGVARYSYRAIAERSAQVAHELHRSGIGIEDRVFIVLEDGVEWVASFFGAMQAGATVMFLNHQTTSEELAFYLLDSRAKGIITSKAVAALLPADRPHLRTLVVADDPATIARLASHPTAFETARTLEEDFAIWLYSSGSTGAPKAAVHRAYDFVYNAERYAKDVLRITASDVTLSVPKLFFGYATGTNLLFPFFFGGAAVLFPDKPTPARLFELIAKHRATLLVNVPTMIAQMAAHYDEATPKPDVGSLRVVTSAGEALPVDLYHRWKSGVGVEVLDGIGSAEMFHVFISAKLGDVVPGSLGTLVEGYAAKIVDGDGNECGPGKVGTLWVGGGSAAAFYWQRHEKSREVLRGGWVVTGDQFMRDERGHFFYRGRADDLMKVAGRWVAPQEIEDALVRHEAVREAGVAPFESEGLTKPCAFVIPKAGVERTEALAKALADHVASALAPFKAPRFVELVDDLPRGDRGKLSRAELRKLAKEAAARRGFA
jgi:benzoate-CoA ligase